MEGGRVVLELRAQNPGFADARDGNLLPDIKSTTIHSQQSESIHNNPNTHIHIVNFTGVLPATRALKRKRIEREMFNFRPAFEPSLPARSGAD